MQPPHLESVPLFTTDRPSRAVIVDTIRAYDTPGHRHVVGLLLQISKLLDHAPITKVDVYPTRQHGWAVRKWDSEEDVDAFVANDSIMNYERRNSLGSYPLGGKWYFFSLAWYGVRPAEDLVRKKLKEHGVRFLSEN